MRLSIYSIKKVLFDGEATSLNCQTEDGEITVLDHHAPLISVLSPGAIKVIDKNQKSTYYNGSGGFVEVGSKNHVTLIINE